MFRFSNFLERLVESGQGLNRATGSSQLLAKKIYLLVILIVAGKFHHDEMRPLIGFLRLTLEVLCKKHSLT